MGSFDLNQTVTTDYSSIAPHTISAATVDVVAEGQGDKEVTNPRFAKDWGYFLNVPKLKSAILTKAIFCVGKGYTTEDLLTEVRLDHITGDGKQTFNDILFNMVVGKMVARDSFAEIIWNNKDKRDFPINLIIRSTDAVTQVYRKNGTLKGYKLRGVKDMINPRDMFHLSHNKLCGQTHGISVPESVEKIIVADDENFDVMKRIAQFQSVPFIIFKVKSDNATTISTFKANIKSARQKGEDLIIPDDENLLAWEVVELNPASFLMQWRNSLDSQFYVACGLPLSLFGGNQNESGGKIEYLGHETVFEYSQREIEKQVEAQLNLKINLIPPTTLLDNLQQDESKDAQNALGFQPADATASKDGGGK